VHARDVHQAGGPSGQASERDRFGSLGFVLHVLVVAWGAHLALLPLNDNSFFTHLATGRLILDRGSVPTADPYTFTAQGEPWTVQSWLASLAYAGAERLGGAVGLRVLVVVVFAIAASLVWRLTAAATSVVPRLLLAAVAMLVCSGVWSERPYMVGFIGLCLVWLAVDGRLDHRWLIPYLWVWGNAHGSFPLALLLAGALAAGAAIDQRLAGQRIQIPAELLVLRSISVGALLAVISPLGLRALTFPISALGRPGTFGLVLEWQAPRFTSVSERAFLVLVVAAIASLVVERRWRYVVAATAFVVAALLARRNLVMAVPVLVPVIAAGLPSLGTLHAATRPVLGRSVATCCIALASIVVVSGLDRPALGLGGYPLRPLAVLAERGPETLVAQDFTGNLLEVLDGAGASVFVDDRVDMFPAEVVEDFRVLSSGEPGWDRVLDAHGATVVAWARADPLGSIMAADPRWRIELSDTRWILAVRR
jgi:hypothetical protein